MNFSKLLTTSVILTSSIAFTTLNAENEAPAAPATATEAPAKVAASETPAPVPATPSEAKTEKNPQPEHLQSQDQKGKIEKVDASAGTFVVEGKSFSLTKKAKVYIDNVKSSLSDIKDGDLVDIVYFTHKDGSLHATRVIKGQPVSGKKSKSKSEETK